MREILYKDVKMFVSEDGRVYGPTKKERKLQTNKKRQNRKYVNTSKGAVFVHLLIAMGYPEICGKIFEGCEIHHIDGDCTNNNALNLKVVSKEEHLKLHQGIIIQEDKDGNILGQYISSLDAEKATGISGAAIRECLRGKSKTSGGYLWYRKTNGLVS